MADNTSKDAAEAIAELIEGVDSDFHAPEIEGAVTTEETRGPRAMGFNVEEINEDHALVIIGSKAIVIKEQFNGPVRDRIRFLSPDAFFAWFANRPTETVGQDGKIRITTWGRRWFTHRDRRQFDGIEFFPNPDGVEGTARYLDLWHGFGMEPKADGTYDVFRDHLLTNVCGADPKLFDWVFGWFAHIVQRPRERLGTALVLRGRQGVGKSKIGEVFGSLFPAHYCQIDNPRYVTGQFNAHMASCLLLHADEAVWAGDKTAEGRLKGLVTAETQMIESKGIDAIQIKNYVRLMMTSNETWVVPAGMDERRFCVLDVNDRCAQDHDYFCEMMDELDRGGRARLLHDLLHFNFDKIDLRKVPNTDALFEQKLHSLESVDSWWYSRLIEGTPARGVNTWPTQIAAAALYADYVHAAEQVGTRRKRDPGTFGLTLKKLAPNIERVRRRAEASPGDGKRVYSYVLPALTACRDVFSAMLGHQIDWPPLSDAEIEPVGAQADDEIVPL